MVFKYTDLVTNNSNTYRARNRNIVAQIKENTPCAICGESDPRCLDFHHVDKKTEKLNHIVQYRGYSVKRLIKEIEKCEIICSNCHRKTYANFGVIV